jgi:hypothetical protein
MVVSALTAPIYARSLIKVVLNQKLTFNVTAKGTSASPDRLMTFRYSLLWAIVPVVTLVVAETRQRPYPMMMAWTGIIVTVCLAPIGIWLFDEFRGRRQLRRARKAEVRVPQRQHSPHEGPAEIPA